MEIAATERLRLRPLQAEDLRVFVAYRRTLMSPGTNRGSRRIP